MRLRRNHKSNKSNMTIFKLFVYVAIVLGILFLLFKDRVMTVTGSRPSSTFEGYEVNLESASQLPSSNGEVIDHRHFKLSYIEEHEQAEWVYYHLTRDMLRQPNVARSKRFEEDDMVSTGSANYYDYRGSGYTRGHLAPAGDMAHSFESMNTSFLMSNISPQLRSFNNGVWKELEEQTRDWTFQNNSMYIVTGPVLNSSEYQKIGKAKVSVPTHFYKALLTLEEGKQKGVAFLIPHQKSEAHLHTYAISIDSLESILNLDLFYDLSDAEHIEGQVDKTLWPVSEARYKLRVDRWNNE